MFDGVFFFLSSSYFTICCQKWSLHGNFQHRPWSIWLSGVILHHVSGSILHRRAWNTSVLPAQAFYPSRSLWCCVNWLHDLRLDRGQRSLAGPLEIPHGQHRATFVWWVKLISEKGRSVSSSLEIKKHCAETSKYGKPVGGKEDAQMVLLGFSLMELSRSDVWCWGWVGGDLYSQRGLPANSLRF